MGNIFKFFRESGSFTMMNRLVLTFLIILCIGLVLGCKKKEEEGSTTVEAPAGTWTTISIYYYDYDGDGRLIRERNDNNANGSVVDETDIIWSYTYDGAGDLIEYLKYQGINQDLVGIGTYYYNTAGCNDRLEEETLQGTDIKVWTYEVDTDCRRSSYHYEGNGEMETGTYVRNQGGWVVRLRMDNDEYWDYVLGDNGERLRYDFHDADGSLIAYGIYTYDENGKLDRLENFERR